MPQSACPDAHAGVYNINETPTIFLATRQELLERLRGDAPYYPGERVCRRKGFSGQQQPTWHKI